MKHERTSALEELGQNKARYLKLNDLFENYISQFDDAFNRGVQLDLDYYVERDSNNVNYTSFEDEMFDILFGASGGLKVKTYILRGKVGSGKTSFVRYLSEQKFQKNNQNVKTIFIDICRLFGKHKDVNDDILYRFYDAVESCVTMGPNPLFASLKDFYAHYLNEFGFSGLSDQWILENYKTHLSCGKILKVLLGLIDVKNILIVIDNIDENSQQVIGSGVEFVYSLNKEAVQLSKNKMPDKNIAILFTLRDYNPIYYSTERLATKDLPPVSEVRMITKRFIQLEKAITSSATKKTSRTIDINLKDTGPSAITYTITSEAVHKFILDLVQTFENESELLALLKNLSDGNLKVLVNNTYYLLHSNKLPLTPLFNKVFLSRDDLNYQKYERVFPLSLALECLLAIHYPFFDKNHSLILNIFNADSSAVVNDFQNTLVIPRLLCLIENKNESGIKLSEVYTIMNSASFSKKYIDIALTKCISFGIINSNHGINFDDFSPDTIIRRGFATKLYIKSLIFSIGYLQYVCEDVYMPQEYIVPIQQKYKINEVRGDKSKRMDGVLKFIDFLESEEKLEAQMHKYSGPSTNKNILELFGINSASKGIKISDAIRKVVMPKINKILSSSLDIDVNE